MELIVWLEWYMLENGRGIKDEHDHFVWKISKFLGTKHRMDDFWYGIILRKKYLMWIHKSWNKEYYKCSLCVYIKLWNKNQELPIAEFTHQYWLSDKADVSIIWDKRKLLLSRQFFKQYAHKLVPVHTAHLRMQRRRTKTSYIQLWLWYIRVWCTGD